MPKVGTSKEGMSNSSSSGGGIGFVGLLTIAFVVLKLTGVIAWEWVWVLAPLWISASIVALILLWFGVTVLAIYLTDKRAFRKRRAVRPSQRSQFRA